MKYFASLLALAFFASRANAQITLNEQDFLSNVTESQTTFSSTDTLDVRALENLNGANVIWDFTGRTYAASTESSTTTILTYPDGAPLANDADFTNSTNVVRSIPSDPTKPTMYNFVKVDATGWWSLGSVQDSAGIATKISGYNPPLQLFAFPLTYRTTWTSTSSAYSSSLPPGGTLTLTDTDLVDGWGTLQLPSSQGTQALRDKKSLTISVSAFGFGQTTTQYFYEWYTKNGTNASIDADSDLRPSDISYSLPAAGSVESDFTSGYDPLTLRLSSNPVTNTETHLFYTIKSSGPASLWIMDPLGRNVQMLQNGYVSAGEHIIPINVGAMAPGTYFIRLESNGMRAMRKLIIQ